MSIKVDSSKLLAQFFVVKNDTTKLIDKLNTSGLAKDEPPLDNLRNLLAASEWLAEKIFLHRADNLLLKNEVVTLGQTLSDLEALVHTIFQREKSSAMPRKRRRESITILELLQKSNKRPHLLKDLEQLDYVFEQSEEFEKQSVEAVRLPAKSFKLRPQHSQKEMPELVLSEIRLTALTQDLGQLEKTFTLELENLEKQNAIVIPHSPQERALDLGILSPVAPLSPFDINEEL